MAACCYKRDANRDGGRASSVAGVADGRDHIDKLVARLVDRGASGEATRLFVALLEDIARMDERSEAERQEMYNALLATIPNLGQVDEPVETRLYCTHQKERS